MLFLLFLSFPIFCNQKFNIRHNNFINLPYNNPKYFFFPSLFNNENNTQESESKKEKKIKKIKIFDKPDLDWIKEKNRLEKIFIATGVVSLTIGFSMFLAGLLNYFVTFNATTIDGEPIITSRNTYISLMGVGSGLMAAGIPFVLVGSIKLGIKRRKKKEKISTLKSLKNFF